LKAFACPQCGASLESNAVYGATVECPYCHSTVIVPTELRPVPPPPPAPSPPLFSDYKPDVVKPQSFSFPRALAFLVVGVIFVLFLVFTLFRQKERVGLSNPISRPGFISSPKATPTPYIFTFGAEGTGQGLFQDAQEVAVDGDGNIYVSDDTLRVQKFNSQGEFLSLWTIPSSTQYFSKIRGGPDRLLVDRRGRVFVVIGGALLKYDEASTEWVGAVRGSDHIYDAALTADGGTVIVSGGGGLDELVVFDTRGKAIRRVSRFISLQLDKQIPVEAIKVAVDGVGNIFAIYALGSIYGTHYYDNEDLAVFRFTAEGKYVNRFSGGGKEPGQFSSPNAIAVDAQSRVYVCDLTNGISVFTADGRYVETIKTPFWVQGMAFDSAGDLFVVGDNKVSKLVLKK